MRKFFYGFFLLIALLLGIGSVVYFKSDRWHTFYCSTMLPLTRWSPQVDRFRECSTVRQRVLRDYSENVAEESQAEYPGWTVTTSADKSREARFRVKLERDRPLVTIFPRVNGSSSGIEVFEVHEYTRRKLFDLKGEDGVWTGVARQYEINIGCTEQGNSNEIFEVELEFVLRGPWAQVWQKDGKILF